MRERERRGEERGGDEPLTDISDLSGSLSFRCVECRSIAAIET